MNILFITATRIGDAILSTGVLAELARRHPDARITVACGPLAQSLFADFPGVATVIAMPKRPLAGHWLALWRQVRATRWDLVVDLRRSLIPWLVRSQARRRLPRTDAAVHRAHFLPRVLGLDDVLEPVIPLSEAHRTRAATLIPDGSPVLALAPVAARPEKTWPIANFCALAGQVPPDWRVAVFAGPGEDGACAALLNQVSPHRLVRVIGEPDLVAVGAALARCQAYVGNDSGLSHLAAAVGVPTLALFGPTDPRHYAPRGPRARVIEAPLAGGWRDIGGLGVDDVARALNDMLAHAP
ncbi:MAG: glycosyltransferase family 9 protein [Rhodospirillaceae bacterium]|nr:glycosyltransferase family 9 protein [Rhodospirillaceae bacterium]